jgi:chemotaxis protein MotB
MITPALLAMLALTHLATTGCVAQSEADDLLTVNRQLEAQNLDLTAQLEQARETIDQIRAGQQSDSNRQGSLEQQVAQREQQISQLQQALDAAEQRLAELASQSGQVMLPAEVDSQLQQLASQNPGLMSYDASRGMVRFQSDLTFGLGSTEVSDQARQTLNQLAQVVNSGAASGYEVRIVGHTDAVPVTNPQNRQRYGDNWGLSAFRAISVKNVLEQAGVDAGRLGIGGYGEHRPQVPHGPNGRAPQNRRVEIYLTTLPPPPAEQAPADELPELEVRATSPPTAAAVSPTGATPGGAEPEVPEEFK